MKLYEILNENGFGVPTPTPEQVATKHRIPIEQVFFELDKGIAAEMEHTLDKDLAAEIALDHLSEMPDYYTQLEQMEKGVEEGEVIDTKFQQKLQQKRGMFYNPDAEPPVSRKTGEPFVRFETEPMPSGKSAAIIGVLADGTREEISFTKIDVANALASAYNAGGYSTQKIERIPLGRNTE